MLGVKKCACSAVEIREIHSVVCNVALLWRKACLGCDFDGKMRFLVCLIGHLHLGHRAVRFPAAYTVVYSLRICALHFEHPPPYSSWWLAHFDIGFELNCT